MIQEPANRRAAAASPSRKPQPASSSLFERACGLGREREENWSARGDRPQDTAGGNRIGVPSPGTSMYAVPFAFQPPSSVTGVRGPGSVGQVQQRHHVLCVGPDPWFVHRLMVSNPSSKQKPSLSLLCWALSREWEREPNLVTGGQ